MVEMDRAAGQAVVIGPYTLEVLEVHPDRVVVALHGPDDEPHPEPGEDASSS
jgi:hypothetical protein